MTATKRRTKTRRRPVRPAPGSWVCPESSCKDINDDATPICLSCSAGMRPGLDGLQQLLLDALEPTRSAGAEWCEMRTRGATGELIAKTIAVILHQQGVEYCFGDRYNLVWRGADHDDPKIWYVPASKSPQMFQPDYAPELEGEKLIDAVRDLYQIGPPQPTPAASPGQSIKTIAEIPDARQAANTGDTPHDSEIPLDRIDIPKSANPRKTFDKTALEQLAASIKTDGVIQPLTVRPIGCDRFELLAGERRLRAAKIAKLATVPVLVKHCDDKTAARIRLVENFVREDLNAVEEAAAFAELLDQHGFTQRELAENFGLSQAKIANAVRILKLPKVWRDRVISQEISATNARQLAAWADVPAVLDEVAEELAERDGGPPSTGELSHWIDVAVWHGSRPITGNVHCRIDGRFFHGKVALTKKDKSRDDLQIREVNGQPRAFNVPLWEELHQAGLARRAKMQQAKSDNTAATNGKPQLSTEEKRQRAKQKREQWQKKLYRWKIAWLQTRVIKSLQQIPDGRLLMKVVLYFACRGDSRLRARELGQAIKAAGGRVKSAGYEGIDAWASLSSVKPAAIPDIVRAAAIAWMSHPFEGFRSDLQPEAIAELAADLDIDFAAEWKLTADYLALHTKDQLAGLAREWQIPLRGVKVKDIAAHLLVDAVDATPPKELLKLKPVRLS